MNEGYSEGGTDINSKYSDEVAEQCLFGNESKVSSPSLSFPDLMSDGVSRRNFEEDLKARFEPEWGERTRRMRGEISVRDVDEVFLGPRSA